MELRLFDTLTREKRLFTPLNPDNVRMYVCGPTVYDFAHIGNARPVIVFDVLFRLLRHLYGENHVTYVRNITDVDDKINDRAARDFPGLPLNEAIRKVTEKTAALFHADAAALGCLPPTFEPRATDFVLPRADGKTDMVTLIKQLIAGGHAYEAGGEVLFDTQSMPDYGALSGRNLDEQRPGARVAVDAHKKNPLDFVLWKQSSDDEPGWESPWGRGRPGWHIECSAMSAAYLGDVFDIHGGGIDLIFPHHENEIAQSRCAHGTSVMANYWMHNGFLQVEGDKMSKSLGNFVTIRELLADWPGEVLRLNMLKTHYRSPIDWTLKGLEESRKTLDHWYKLIGDNTKAIGEVDKQVLESLFDDLNTSNALTRLHGIASEIHTGASGLAQIELKQQLKASAMLLGLLAHTEGEYLRNDPKAVLIDEAKVQALLERRVDARARKDFKESDRIRDELAAMGVIIKDSKEGTTWEIAR
jgi:cysteinyl-tRNA synthetase